MDGGADLDLEFLGGVAVEEEEEVELEDAAAARAVYVEPSVRGAGLV